MPTVSETRHLFIDGPYWALSGGAVSGALDDGMGAALVVGGCSFSDSNRDFGPDGVDDTNRFGLLNRFNINPNATCTLIVDD